MPEKPAVENNCEMDGIFSPVAGILGSLQANEVLKTILNFKNDLNNQMIIFDSIKINLRKIKLSLTQNAKINVQNNFIFIYSYFVFSKFI